MGPIGQELPKVLWPVFERSLLELQVAYAKSLGIEKIYINLHHMGEKIEAFCKDKSTFEGVQFLWEKPEILDIGGAVHNLASQASVKYKGKLLVLNADQFFYMKKEDLFRYLEPYQKSPGVLFTYKVNSSLGYNALEIGANRVMKGIVKNKDIPANSVVETYTGISLVDLSQLEKTPGVSPFFESVCPYQKKEIPCVLLENLDYWDFGTVKRYWETTFQILETYRVKSTHPFLRFLVQERALKTWKIDLQEMSYHAKSPRVVNFNADAENSELSSCIILQGKPGNAKKGSMIYWNGISDEVK
jgi:NDP-sugar pyrophosphorylase family protein